ncbi:MAG: YdcF family protein [Leptospiraceae bacterium]|nr:YdcF family protein [Leptospiraceae bacterium]
MFFYLSKIFAALFFPYPLFMILMGIALFRLPRSRFKWTVVGAYAIILLFSTNFVSGQLIGLLEDEYPQPTPIELEDADAVIVLGGMVNPLTGRGDWPEFIGPVDRILLGESLLHRGIAPILLISGGSGLIMQTGDSEAVILHRWLLKDRGWPAERILIEPDSRNTAENAMESMRLARERGWRRVILVTSAFHMPRSVLCFRKVADDIVIVPYPVDYYRLREFAGPEAIVPTNTALSITTLAVKEMIGLAAYRLAGYI